MQKPLIGNRRLLQLVENAYHAIDDEGFDIFWPAHVKITGPFPSFICTIMFGCIGVQLRILRKASYFHNMKGPIFYHYDTGYVMICRI